MPGQPRPPAPGVSAIDGAADDGTVTGRTPLAPSEGKPPVRRRRRGPTEEVIADPSKGRRIPIGAAATSVGVRAAQRDVIEMEMPKTSRPRRRMAEFESVDGNTYHIRLVMPDGKKNPLREFLVMFLALREWRLGGDPFVVFDGFKLSLADADGQQVWPPLCPVPDLDTLMGWGPFMEEASPEADFMAALQTEAGVQKSELEREEEETGFSMGVIEEDEQS